MEVDTSEFLWRHQKGLHYIYSYGTLESHQPVRLCLPFPVNMFWLDEFFVLSNSVLYWPLKLVICRHLTYQIIIFSILGTQKGD